MVEDLIRLIKLGIITVDSIKDLTIKAEVQARLALQKKNIEKKRRNMC